MVGGCERVFEGWCISKVSQGEIPKNLLGAMMKDQGPSADFRDSRTMNAHMWGSRVWTRQ